MTQKEKLYNQYVSLLETALSIFPINSAQSSLDQVKKYRAADYKVYELKDYVEHGALYLEEAKREKAKADFYSTPEGMKLKKELQEQMDHLNEERDKIVEKFENKIQEFVQKSFGNKFIATGIGTTSFRVNMIDEEGKEIFGHGWDYYMDTFGHRKLTINYGCMGSFNPFESPERTKFLEGLAIASSPLAFGIINEIMQSFNFEMTENREELRSLRKKLDNPKM